MVFTALIAFWSGHRFAVLLVISLLKRPLVLLAANGPAHGLLWWLSRRPRA